MRFKVGDKVMFLGVPEDPAYYAYAARSDFLIPMRVYTVLLVAWETDRIKLKEKAHWHLSRFFQKVEGKL